MFELLKIKKGIDVLLENSYKKSDKSATQLIFESIGEDKNVQILYFCATNLESPPKLSDEEIEEFINENIILGKSIEKTNLKKYTRTLSKVELSPLEQAINTILFENRTALNFTNYNESRAMVVEHIKSKNKILSENLTEYSSEDILFAKMYANDPDGTYKNICEDCIGILDEKLTSDDVENDVKILIYRTKERIYESQIKEGPLVKNVLEMLKLKEELLQD
jgi:hypothetical protein